MKPVLIFDTECYTNYWLLAFRNVTSKKITTFELYDGVPFDREKLCKILGSYCLVGFNSINYDMPLIFLVLKLTADPSFKVNEVTSLIKKANDLIINGKLKPWNIEDNFKFKISKKIDHIDLIEVAPGKASLKIYGGRMHAKTVWELPYVPDELITPDKKQEILDYNINDLETTELLYHTLIPQLELREKMSKEYGEDLRSKSDAQIAEAVINSRLEEKSGKRPEKNVIKPESVFRYQKPSFIVFDTPEMQNIARRMVECLYVTDYSGKIKMSEPLDKELLVFADSKYRVGVGGLHSCEKNITHSSDDEWIIIDRDVASYYPAIIINCMLYPKHMGRNFLSVYHMIVKRRLEAKASGDTVTADSLKITINGSFGKFGSKWSTLYSPDLLIQTTLTGQLSLLMLIEMLELNGAKVLSANTDGVVFKCRVLEKKKIDNIIYAWEILTGFDTEETPYRMLCSRDVNNYIAVKTNGGSKMKGAYTPPGLQKNPANEICVQAVIDYLKKDTPLRETILECEDPKKFVTVRTVKGGAVKNDIYLGKAIRWYYRRGEKGTINYKINNYTVPRTEGAAPLMTLPETVPDDIDYNWYINEAKSILNDIGAQAA